MKYSDVLKMIDAEMQKDLELYGESFELNFQSYSTYVIATTLTEQFYKITNLMATESEDLTEELIAENLKDIIKTCVKSIGVLIQEEPEKVAQHQEEEKRVIGFRVADKEEKTEKTKRDIEKENYKYPIDTYAVSYQEIYDESEFDDYYDE